MNSKDMIELFFWVSNEYRINKTPNFIPKSQNTAPTNCQEEGYSLSTDLH